jgi:apolipoprotein N-acyltransferase
VTICYEDVIPDIFRGFVCDDAGHKRVDFMLNISNDGWFGHGTQQAQHLVNCAFRAIENRIGIARAVNTGISGFIDPDGQWRDLVQGPGGGLNAGGTGFSVARIKLDPRVTFYSKYGDVFGLLCVAVTVLVMGESTVLAVKRRRARK